MSKQNKLIKTKNTFFNFQTIMQFSFLLIAFIFIAMLSTGFEFNWGKIISWNFAILALSRLVFVLVTYNIVFGIDNINRRSVKDTKYYVTLATYKKKTDVIYTEKRFEELEKAVDAENTEKYEKACTKLLRTVSSRLSYNDVVIVKEDKSLDYMEVDALCNKFKLTDAIKLKLSEAIAQIQNGQVTFEEIEADDLLTDKDSDGDKTPTMKFDFKAFLLKQNIMQSGSFLLSTVVMTVMSFTGGMANFWIELAKNLTLLLGGCVSAITLSYNYVKIRTGVFELRNQFYIRRMSIMEKYIVIEEMLLITETK